MFDFLKPSDNAPAPEPAAEPAAVPEREPHEVPAGYPILAPGSADPSVLVLVEKLNGLGAELPVTNIVTPELLNALNQWRAHEEIVDDPAESIGFPPNSVIGTATWRAVLDLPDPKTDEPAGEHDQGDEGDKGTEGATS